MKILLDHCVPKGFRRELSGHTVLTTAQMGWTDFQNGLLLSEAAKQFEVFLTIDKRIKAQQKLDSLPIAVVILDAPAITPESLKPFAPYIIALLPTLRSGQLVEVDATGNVATIAPGRPNP